MLKPYEPHDDEPVLPECHATAVRIQRVLDGEPDSLDADTHPSVCSACRERVRAARMLLVVLAAPREPAAVPAGFADGVMSAMWEERHTRTRRRSYAAVSAAIAASVLLALAGAYFFSPKPEVVRNQPLPWPELPGIVPPEVAPPPREKQAAPIRIGDEVAKAGQSLLDAPKPLAESVAIAPKLLDTIPNPFKLPAAQPDPMVNALEPVGKSLTELPTVAASSLEPVTDTAEKAFNRFLRDVGAVKPN